MLNTITATNNSICVSKCIDGNENKSQIYVNMINIQNIKSSVIMYKWYSMKMTNV